MHGQDLSRFRLKGQRAGREELRLGDRVADNVHERVGSVRRLLTLVCPLTRFSPLFHRVRAHVCHFLNNAPCRFTPDGLVLMAGGLLTPRGGWQGMGGGQRGEEGAGSATDMPVKLPLREAAGGESKRGGEKSKKQQGSGADSSSVLGAGKAGKGRKVSAERQREQERVKYSRS